MSKTEDILANIELTRFSILLNSLKNEDDLAASYKFLVKQKRYHEATNLVLVYFINKIKKYEDPIKGIRVYNTRANDWSNKNKLGLPKDFVIDIFKEMEEKNGHKETSSDAGEASR